MSRSGLKEAWKVTPVSRRSTSSTHPISTSLSPFLGSKPVVSVSKIISRIEALIWTLSGVETRGDEANLTVRLAFGAARFDDEIGARALDAIGDLQAADRLQLRRRHAGAAHHAPPLHPRGRRDDGDRADLAPAALFQKQWKVQHDALAREVARSEEHTSELPSLTRLPYAVLCLNKK